MISIEELIGDLLIQHNCVVVPAFGGFVAQRSSAKLDPEKGVMIPPRKSVLFNRQLVNNDGLLISAYAQNNKLSFTDALQEVDAVVSKWQGELKSGQRIAIDRVGYLYLDAERNLCFEQDRFYNLLLESFGLGPIHFVSVSDVQAIESKQAIETIAQQVDKKDVVSENAIAIELPVFNAIEETPIVPLHEKRPNKTWRYIAAACLVPVAFYSVWLPVKTDVLQSGMLSLRDFNPFHKNVKAVYQPNKQESVYEAHRVERQLASIPKNAKTFAYELDEDTYVPIKLNERQAVQQVVENDAYTPEIAMPVQTIEPQKQKAATYAGGYVIVGSFASRANAEKLAGDLKKKGFNAQVMEANGTIRVSAGSAGEFTEIQPKLVDLGLAPWILK